MDPVGRVVHSYRFGVFIEEEILEGLIAQLLAAAIIKLTTPEKRKVTVTDEESLRFFSVDSKIS